jgi:hypothetical protein
MACSIAPRNRCTNRYSVSIKEVFRGSFDPLVSDFARKIVDDLQLDIFSVLHEFIGVKDESLVLSSRRFSK